MGSRKDPLPESGRCDRLLISENKLGLSFQSDYTQPPKAYTSKITLLRIYPN